MTLARSMLLVLSSLMLIPSARAEQPVMPACTCNDDCKNKWPYSGICVQSSWGKHCSYYGPGIPCTDGGPVPDLPDLKVEWPPWGCGDAMPNCGCNDDCKSYGLAFCVKHSKSGCAPICSKVGPGIVCAKKDVGLEGSPLRACKCNDDCSSLNATPYCGYHSGAWYCSHVGPGVACPKKDYRTPAGDDWFPRDSGPGGSAAAPRGGCSLAADAPTPGAGVLLLLGLAGFAGFAARRRR